MLIEILLQDKIEGKVFDISEIVDTITYETSILSQPGKLTFSMKEDAVITLNEGSIISVKIDGIGIFFGYLFRYVINDSGKMAGIAYDQTRYLKNKDTYVTSNQTASQVFARICADFKLQHKIIDPSTYILPARIHDNKTLFEIVQHGIDTTLINSGKWYLLRDNFGTLEFVDIERLKTLVYIGDKYNLIDYTYESSIDQDSYNQVKLIKNNQTDAKREIYIVKDSVNIGRWGLLQYFEAMDENANEAQIKARAEQLLKLKNRATKKLKINAVGNLTVMAGSGVIIGIDDLTQYGIPYNKYFMVSTCVHKFANNYHEMQLELQVIT